MSSPTAVCGPAAMSRRAAMSRLRPARASARAAAGAMTTRARASRRASAASGAAAASLTGARGALAPRCRRRRGDGGEIGGIDRGARDLMADVALDVGQRYRVFVAAEGNGVALGAGACRASDAVNVILGVVRQIEIEHMAHIRNVQAA